MIELIPAIILALVILWIIYPGNEDDGKCPECGGELFRWKLNRLDCRDCSYKKY